MRVGGRVCGKRGRRRATKHARCSTCALQIETSSQLSNGARSLSDADTLHTAGASRSISPARNRQANLGGGQEGEVFGTDVSISPMVCFMGRASLEVHGDTQ